MQKESLEADQLIWLFHVGLVGTNMSTAKIAIVPGPSGGWIALTSAYERRRFPMLASNVASIQQALRARYHLKSR